jgi:hypothetical protein
MRRLTELIGVDHRSLERWRRWWREIFTATPFWQNARTAFMPPVDEKRIPAAIDLSVSGCCVGSQLASDKLCERNAMPLIGTQQFVCPCID